MAQHKQPQPSTIGLRHKKTNRLCEGSRENNRRPNGGRKSRANRLMRVLIIAVHIQSHIILFNSHSFTAGARTKICVVKNSINTKCHTDRISLFGENNQAISICVQEFHSFLNKRHSRRKELKSN